MGTRQRGEGKEAIGIQIQGTQEYRNLGEYKYRSDINNEINC